MPDQLSFFVAGLPVPQGGVKPVPLGKTGRTVLVTTGGAGLKQWRKKVTDVAALAVNADHWPMVSGAVSVAYRFLLPMPASRPATIKRMLIAHSTVKPDLDKLTRAIGDSLTDAKVYADDARIAVTHVEKYEVVDHSLIGVEIVVARLDLEVTPAMQRLLDRRLAAPRVR